MSFHKEGECCSIPAKPKGIEKRKEDPQIVWKLKETVSKL